MDHENIVRRWCLATTIADYTIRRCMKCSPKKAKPRKRRLLNRSWRKKHKAQKSRWDLRSSTRRDSRKESYNGLAWMYEKEHVQDINSFYLKDHRKYRITAKEIICLYLPPYGHMCVFSTNHRRLSMGVLRILIKHIDVAKRLARIYGYLVLKSDLLVNNNEHIQGECPAGGSNLNVQLSGKEGSSVGDANDEVSKAMNACRNSRSAYYLLGRRSVLDSLVARQYGCHMRLEDLTKVVDKVVPGVIGVEPIVETCRSASL